MSFRVVSTCLFGGPQAARHRTCPDGAGTDFYRKYLPAWVRAHHNVYSGWKWIIYHDDELLDDSRPYNREIWALAEQDLLELVYAGPATERNEALLWRLKPLFDPLCEILACRDLDSLPTPLDRACLLDFEGSGSIAHGINDSISHCFAVGGGMCGFRCAEVRKRLFDHGISDWQGLIDIARRGQTWHTPGQEQSFLNGYLLRMLYDGVRVNDLVRAPDVGYQVLCVGSPGPELDEINRQANDLMVHLGASGFDVERAVTFWSQYGDQEIEARIAAAEAVTVAT